MAYDYVKKDASSVKQNDEAGGQVAQLKKSHSNASMASMLGEGDFSEISSFLEATSGVSLGDVEVHYNSHKPAAIGALAYAKGNEVFLGPGQEQHLPHELTHVVQQKQGIVEPTGSIGGMPVNTSDSLEAAADRMSTAVPSGAVSGATPPGGVVQGVFISKSLNGRSVPEEDVEAVIKMLEGAYQSHIDAMEAIRKENETTLKHGSNIKDADNLREGMLGDKKLLQAYKNGKSSVRARFKKKIKSKDEVYIEEYLQAELYKAQETGFNAAKKGKGITLDTYAHLSDAGNALVDPVKSRRPEFTLNGFLRDVGRFTINDTVFEGLDDVTSWSPVYDADSLTQVRMGGSSSLTGNIGDGTAVKTATNKQLTKMKKQFMKSTEISRKAALEIRSNKYNNVGFAFLYKLLKNLNKTVQEGMDSGGKLRAAHATAGVISSVAQNQLPEELYWLLNKIGTYIRYVGDMQDEKLRKSQAIRVAAFSFQMLISLHPFKDGNGRTCRLFADTILQAFGLPPYTPLTMPLGGTVGANGDNEYNPKIDFEKGAYAFLYSVRESSRILSGKERTIPSNYEYLRIKDQPMPDNFATGPDYAECTLAQRKLHWEYKKAVAQEEMRRDIILRETRAVEELRRKQKQMEEWKKDPELKRADLELQARQDDYRNARRGKRRAAINKSKNVNLENYKGSDADNKINNISNKKDEDEISLDNSSNNIINNKENDNISLGSNINNLISNEENDNNSVASNINNLISNEENDNNSVASNINNLIGIKENEEINLDSSINNLAGIKENDEISLGSNINNKENGRSSLGSNINNNEDDKISVDSGFNNIINIKGNNKISNEDEEILINLDNGIKKDIKGEGKGAKDKDPAILPINPQKMKERTPHSISSKATNIGSRTFGHIASNALFFIPMGVSELILLKKKHDLKKLFLSEDRQNERRTHDIIPGWNGARFSDREQQEQGKDILDDFRRVPTVWAHPIMEPADNKNGYGTKDELLPPKVIAYCAQPKSFSSSSIEGMMNCGHAFLGIEFSQYSKITGRNQRYRIKCGFYPARTSENTAAGIILGKDTIGVGELCDDTDHVYDISRTYTSSRANIRAMAEKAEKYTEEGGYGWYSRNCVTFLRDTLKAGNLDGDTVDKVFSEEVFRFGSAQNAGFAFGEGLLTTLNMNYHYKMLRYGNEDDTTYQGQGNKRMTTEEYKRWEKTYNTGGYNQKGWIPASVAENLRRLDDKSSMGSFSHVTDHYKQLMQTINDKKGGNAQTLLPKNVQALIWFADKDDGEIKRTGDKLKTSIKTIIANDTGTQILNNEKDEFKKWSEVDKWIRDRGKQYEEFRDWLDWYISYPIVEFSKIIFYVKRNADIQIREWKKKNPNYENDPELKEKMPEYKNISISECLRNLPQNDLNSVYDALKKALIDVNTHYAETLQYDARIHHEVMDYLSALQMSLKLVETINEAKHYEASSNKSDLGPLRINAMTKNTKVSAYIADKDLAWERDMSPSTYEAFLQVYGTPAKVFAAIDRKKELEKNEETKTSEYHKLVREFSLVDDYEKSHRYLLNKEKYTRGDMQYILDLKQKENAGDDNVMNVVVVNGMSKVYLGAFFENIFGGVKEKLKADNTLILPKDVVGLKSDDPMIDTCASWLADYFRDKAQKYDAKAQIKILLRCLNESSIVPKDKKKVEVLVRFFELYLCDIYIKQVFPVGGSDAQTKENLFCSNINYIAARVMDKNRPLYPIILQCAKDIFIPADKDDDSKDRFAVGNISNTAGLETAIEGLNKHLANGGKSKNDYEDANIGFDKILKAKEKLAPSRKPPQTNMFWQPRNEAEKKALTYIASQKAKSNGYPRKKGQCPLYAWQLRFLRPEIKTELAKYVNI